jgi:hypothetical protein
MSSEKFEDQDYIVKLIQFAREREQLTQKQPDRSHLKAALIVLGRSPAEADRIIDNARLRVRKAADKAEELLDWLLAREKPWPWTHPRQAIKEMRSREFGPGYEDYPLTDIELALVQKGNVLWIIALYPALKWPIFARLKSPAQHSSPAVSSTAAESPNTTSPVTGL